MFLANGNVTVFDVNEGPRDGLTIVKPEKLKLCFPYDGTGTVAAGNGSSLNDTASDVMVMSREKAEKLGLNLQSIDMLEINETFHQIYASHTANRFLFWQSFAKRGWFLTKDSSDCCCPIC